MLTNSCPGTRSIFTLVEIHPQFMDKELVGLFIYYKPRQASRHKQAEYPD